MKITFYTLFPELIQSYFGSSILGRALADGKFDADAINLRRFSNNSYCKVDSAQVGGGAGQVIDYSVLRSALEHKQDHIIFLSPVGKRFDSHDAIRLSRKKELSFVCARYHGYDERALEDFADEVYSIGDFILMGGELAALCMAESILRWVPNILGNEESLMDESFEGDILEAPVFASERNGDRDGIPSELLKGNHARISDLKQSLATLKTKYFRPDLWAKRIIREKTKKG